MSGSRGRHARPDEPDDVDVAAESASGDEAASHDRAGVHPVTPVTQPLPVVRRESSAPESPAVRAVAKRVPSALPALGRDEITDVPSSARATADRRRRARSGTDEEQAAGHAEAAGSEQGAGSEHASNIEQAASDEQEPAEGHRSTPAVPRPRLEPPIERIGERAPAPPAADAPEEVELVPVGNRSRSAAAPADQSTPAPMASAGSAGLATPAAGAATAKPVTRPPAPTAEPADDPAPEEIVDAEIVDEQPRPYVAVHAQTDEWVTVTPTAAPEPAPVAQPAPVPQPAPAAPAAPPLLAAPTPPPLVAQSPAPAALSASLGSHTLVMPTVTEEPAAAAAPPPLRPGGTSDTWETSPLPTIGDQYQGRRRAKRRSGRLTGWLVVVGVVLALSAAIAVPFLFTSGQPDPSAAEDPATTAATSPTSVAPTTAATSGLPIVLAPSATPSPTTESSTTTAEPTQTATTNPAPPASFSVTLEAESGSLSGCAATRNVGGATVVDRLGEDWGNCNRGRVTFNNVNLPAGTFTVTIYYVFGQDSPQWSSSRYGELEIERDGGGTDIEFGNTYPRTTSCCQSWTTSSFTISAGSYDITFTNPNRQGWSNRAPAIDRIVIQQQ